MSEQQLRTAALSSWKRMALTGGILAILLGLVLLIWPGKTLLVVGALIGIWLILLGILRLADAAVGRGRSGASRGFSALAGAIYIVAGIVVLANLHASLRFVALLLGLIWIFSGISEVIAGFTRTPAGERVATIAIGLLNVFLGVIIVVWPGPTLVFIVWMTAIWLILLGLMQLWFAWQAGKAAKASADPAYHVVDEAR